MAATPQQYAQYEKPFKPGELEVLPVFSDIERMGTPPTFAEMLQAINSLKNNKLPGTDGITGEVLKDEGTALHHKEHRRLATAVGGCANHLHLHEEERPRYLWQ